MLRAVFLISCLTVVLCQYPRQRAPPHRPPPEYEAQPDYDDYQPRSRPPPPPPPPQPRVSPNSVRLRPASVHYVNIGAELAGDYKFGYDTGKGDDGQSFREETRLPDGTVQGAYGYVDETGQQRIVKYTAGKEGFRILKDPSGGSNAVASREAPKPAQPAAAYRPPPQPAQPPAYVPPPPAARAPPAYVPPPPARAPARNHVPAPQPAYSPEPAYRPQPAYRPAPAPRRPPAPQPQPYTPPKPRTREYAPRKPIPMEEPDYDYPDNEIHERRLVPIDTSLFNYNIGTNNN